MDAGDRIAETSIELARSLTPGETPQPIHADDQLIGRAIVWTSGACEGEMTDITDYAETNGHITYTAITLAPSASDTFVIL